MKTNIFDKELKKEKLNLFKNDKKQKPRLNKDLKNIVVIGGSALLLSEAINVLNS